MAKIIDNSLKNKQITNQNLTNNSLEQENNKGIISIIGQFLPFAPMLFEQFTGQKISQPMGTIAEIQSNLQQVLTNQQQIFNKITILENNANQQLISLDKRLANLRLTYEQRWEKKQIEQNTRNSSETEEEY